jgi:hypothetical protein
LECPENRYLRTNRQHHLRLEPFLFLSKLHKYRRSRNKGTRHLDAIFQRPIFCYHTRLYTYILFSTPISTSFFGASEPNLLEGTLFLPFFRSFVPLTFLPMSQFLYETPGHSCSCSCLEWCARSGICCEEEEGRRTRFAWLAADSELGLHAALVTIKGSVPCLAGPRPQADHLTGREASPKQNTRDLISRCILVSSQALSVCETVVRGPVRANSVSPCVISCHHFSHSFFILTLSLLLLLHCCLSLLFSS